MALPERNDRVSLEGFEQLWESSESVDFISKQIQGILKALVDEKFALKEENNLVAELRGHIKSLEDQIQKLSWQLGQREKELSVMHSEMHKIKAENETLQKQNKENKDILQENIQIKRLANELSMHIMQEKAKNEQLVELLKMLDKPEFTKLAKKLGL